MPAPAGRKRGDAGSTRPVHKGHKVARRVTGRPEIPLVEPLYHTFDQPKPEGSWFDAKAAQAPIAFIETLTQYQGRWKGTPLYLFEWQQRIIREAFGWKTADGNRLYRIVYVEAPRKSGKSTLASGIGLYLAFDDDEGGAQVYFAAYDRDQAKICYDTAQLLRDSSDELSGRSSVYLSKNEIRVKDNPGAFLKPMARDSAKQFGLNIHGLIYDELMTQKSREMWDALLTAQGSREQPLTFAITTAGFDQLSICFEQHELTRQIHEGTAEDPTFLGVVFGAEIDADWTDEEIWKRSQPSMGGSVKIDYYREKAIRAKNQPTEQNAFRTLLLSQWVGQAERFIEMDAWDQCSDEPDEPIGQPAFGGLDLSATQDLTAFVVVSAREGEILNVYCRAWLPEEGIRDRERRDRVPYRVWAEQGFLELTPGRTIDYDFVKAGILEDAERFDLKDIEYDRWNSSHLVQQLTDERIKMIEVGQGFASMSAPMKMMQRKLIQKRYAHGGNPLLRWCASNVAAAVDAAGNVKPDKSRSAHRIDPIAGLIMATDGWMRRGQKTESVYARRQAAAA